MGSCSLRLRPVPCFGPERPMPRRRCSASEEVSLLAAGTPLAAVSCPEGPVLLAPGWLTVPWPRRVAAPPSVRAGPLVRRPKMAPVSARWVAPGRCLRGGGGQPSDRSWPRPRSAGGPVCRPSEEGWVAGPAGGAGRFLSPEGRWSRPALLSSSRGRSRARVSLGDPDIPPGRPVLGPKPGVGLGCRWALGGPKLLGCLPVLLSGRGAEARCLSWSASRGPRVRRRPPKRVFRDAPPPIPSGRSPLCWDLVRGAAGVRRGRSRVGRRAPLLRRASSSGFGVLPSAQRRSALRSADAIACLKVFSTSKNVP